MASSVDKGKRKRPNPENLSRKTTGGFPVQTAYSESYDHEIKANVRCPFDLTTYNSLLFVLPENDNVHIDFAKSSLAMTISMHDDKGGTIGLNDAVSIVQEPLFSLIRSLTVYSLGKTIFTQHNYNLCNFTRKLEIDQSYLNSVMRDLSGYGIDSYPKGNPDIPESAQEARKEKLMSGNNWSLRAPLDIFQFGVMAKNATLLPCSLALQIGLELENSAYGAFKMSSYRKNVTVRIEDISLWVNLKVLAGSTPKSLFDRIEIPHQATQVFEFTIQKDSLFASSGQWRLENTPTRAIVMLTPEDGNTQSANPYQLLNGKCEDVRIEMNGKSFVQEINTQGPSSDVNLLYSQYRALALEGDGNSQEGTWPFTLSSMRQDMFLACFDLTKSGKYGLGMLDAEAVKNASLLSVSMKFTVPVEKNLKASVLFYSTAKTVITEGNAINIEYF